jgi:uncharacterized protein (TIGR02271 family)
MADAQTGEAIPLLTEELHVEKRNVATGKIRVRSVVDVVEEVARATLEEQRIEVTRVPIGQEVAEAPSVRTEGDVVIVPVLEEVLVVEKRLVLKEEVHIRRHVAREDFEVPVTLRKQRGVIEHMTADGQTRTDEEVIP